MNYSDIFDASLEVREDNSLKFDLNKSKFNKNVSDYEFVRYGEPEGIVNFDKVKDDREALIRHYHARGWNNPPACKDREFQKHVKYFRVCLDFWEQFSKDRVFSKDEIYIRCLSEGHTFTKYLKKCRATCLRVYTSETATNYEEDEFHEEYSGYNSIIHERYLIYWDDRDEIDDVKYAFIPQTLTEDKTAQFEKMFEQMISDFRIHEEVFDEQFDLISLMRNTKMHDPVKDKQSLMRDFWSGEIELDAPYYAKRSVVPTECGRTRDAGIGDPSTILKVKMLNYLARVISEKLPYSANCPAGVANARLLRVLKRNGFIHLDFKAFGLTSPRPLMNVMIRKIGKMANIDVTHLVIDDFFINIDGTTYRTERGTVLGWLDSVTSLAVCAILHNLVREGYDIDFITFNDDVEISTRCVTDVQGKLELYRSLAIAKLSYFDFLISLDKTYGSLASVFLERYCYYDRNYGLDMYKEQLTVKAYASSCVTTYPWKAKMLYAAAEQWTKSDYAADRCRSTIKVEFDSDEYNAPLYAGGWIIPSANGIDTSLVDASELQNVLGHHLGKWKTPAYTQQVNKMTKHEDIKEKINSNAYHSERPSEGGKLFNLEDTFDTINIETDNLLMHVSVIGEGYHGRDPFLPNRVYRSIEQIQSGIDWGPDE